MVDVNFFESPDMFEFGRVSMFYVSKICGVVSLSRYILCGDWSAFILAVDASSVVLGLVKGEV